MVRRKPKRRRGCQQSFYKQETEMTIQGFKDTGKYTVNKKYDRNITKNYIQKPIWQIGNTSPSEDEPNRVARIG